MTTTNRRRGRQPKRSGERLEPICLTLPPVDIARLQVESEQAGFGSVSAVVREAVADYLRRLDKRRSRDYQAGSTPI